MGKKRRGKKKYNSVRISRDTSEDIMIITIKSMNRVMFKATCPLNNKQKIENLLKTLELKGFIELGFYKKEKDWF